MSPEQAMQPLLGFDVTIEKDAILPIRICSQHLSALGAAIDYEPSGNSDGEGHWRPGSALRLTPRRMTPPGMNGEIECSVEWRPNELSSPDNEALIQAISGLMSIHGRDGSVPRRLGLDIASVAAGIVAAQGVLAALFAKYRGQEIASVQTSVLEGALLFLYHHLSIATCGDDFPFRPIESGQGPPFATADGHWVELEAMSGESWKAFWARLGVVDAGLVGSSWLPYVYRYLAGRCALPAALHEKTRGFTFAELRQAAKETGVAICRVRSYDEVLREQEHCSSTPPVNSLADVSLPWSIEAGAKSQVRKQRLPALSHAPLAGIRVIEVTSRLQGPLAGILLQKLGAEILKVEPPGGDFGRYSRPAARGVGAAYLAYNRGKEVIEIDYKAAEGRERLRNLAAGADVFLHNWKAGRAEELGLDFDDLSSINPGLIYAHASGWGKMIEEPTDIAGDFLVQAHAACGDGLNPIGELPSPSRLTLLDVTGGLLACEGILAGLCLRERYGTGSRVDTSLYGSAMVLQSDILKAIVNNQETDRLAGRPIWEPLNQPLETSDGFIMVTVEGLENKKLFLAVCGIEDPEEEQAANMQEVARRLRGVPAVEWELLFRKAGIPCAIVRTELAEMSSDRAFRGLIEPVDEACWVPSSPWHFQHSSQELSLPNGEGDSVIQRMPG